MEHTDTHTLHPEGQVLELWLQMLGVLVIYRTLPQLPI